MNVELTFAEPFGSPDGSFVELTFGAGPTGGNIGAKIAISFAGLPTMLLGAAPATSAQISMALTDLPMVTISGTYDPAQYRGPRHSVRMPWQDATPTRVDAAMPWENASRAEVEVSLPIIDATPLLDAEFRLLWAQAARTEIQRSAAWEQATPLRPRPTTFETSEATRTRLEREIRWQQGTLSRPPGTTFEWEETTRTKRRYEAPWQEATPTRKTVTSVAADAAGLLRSWVIPWEEARHPPLGKTIIIPPPAPTPAPDLCYTPPLGDDVELSFTTIWRGPHDTELTFVCDNHPVGPPASVTVPIQEVYMVSNNVSLTLADGTVIPSTSFSLSIDYQSWTWGLTATVAYSALSLFGFDVAGDPVEVWAHINGEVFKLFVQTGASQRQFPTGAITLTGVGLISTLDAPYCPTLTFDNTSGAANAQQIANNVLTENGVSIGWEVEWNVVDWLVPAGAWSFQGTYATALQAIAAAVGGYLQPHPTDLTARILPLYPTASWDWGTVTPDFELPSSVTVVEGISWSALPEYNGVWVSGANSAGVLASVVRTGTAGDVQAEMVTDQLITDAAPAGARGAAILSNTGKQALVSLKLPVLAATGVILPGKFVRYVDGTTTRIGIVRSTTVDAAFPAVWQTIGVETHVS